MQGSLLHRHQSVDSDAPDINDCNELTYELDDIKVKYHSHSKLPSTVHHFSDFSHGCSSKDQVPHNNSPWEPFWTRLDFKVAEIALEAVMTEEQTN